MTTTHRTTTAALLEAGPTVSLDVAAAALGIGRSLAYQLVKRGQFPVRILKLGNRNRVATAELLCLLGMSDDRPAA